MADTNGYLLVRNRNEVYDAGLLAWVSQTQAGGATGGGDASAANQVTGNASLASIDTKLANPLPVSLAAVPSHPVTNPNLDAALSTLATQATLALIKAKTDNLDTALSGIKTGTDKIIAAPATDATLATLVTLADFDTKTGALTEAAPASDTASSGVNGRLQRIAQRLTSLIALLPSALGAGGGLKVDGSGTALPVSGSVTANAGTNLNTSALNLETTQTAMSAKLPASLGQKAMSASLAVVLASDQGAIATQKAPTGGANVLKTGTITTTAVTADQVVLTYTVTAGKTFYLQYVVMYGRLTVLAATATILGAISLETPSGTKVLTFDDVNPTTSELEFNPMPFPEPIPIAAGVVVRIVVTPAAATSMLWRANFGGYEK